jgi:hypothetical protein
MGRVPWTACVWPGLPQLWRQGSWLGLAAALVFAACLNFALVTSLVWIERFDPVWRASAWTMAGAIWLAGVAWSWFEAEKSRRVAAAASTEAITPTEDLFSAATREYLQGNWVGAEQRLQELLRKNAEDVEARLMLATIYRRTKRYPDARNELQRLGTMEKGAHWQFEIDRELENVRKAATAVPTPANEEVEPEKTPPIAKAA